MLTSAKAVIFGGKYTKMEAQMALPYPLRGRDAKERFCREYTIRCIRHGVLLPGDSARCCCGNPIQQEFFQFAYAPSKTFLAGANCGRELIEIAKLATPTLVDPFGLLPQAAKKTTTGAGASGTGESRIPQINVEMAYALDMLLEIWDNKDGYLKSMSEKLNHYPQITIYDNFILSLNKGVRSTIERRKNLSNLRQIYASLPRFKKKGLSMRNIHFPNLEKRLSALGEVSLL
ncbi:MAG: hypothetical protein LBV80_11560 [Deltaproteobacteria bacterium]|nr:hypothetical protein [Deltaproteobacteria bacterium]